MAYQSVVFDRKIKATESCLKIEWKVPCFFSLTKYCKERVTCPEFQYLDAKWYIELLKRNGFWEMSITQKISHYLAATADYTIGIKKIDGTVYKSETGSISLGQQPSFGERTLTRTTETFLEPSNLLRDKMEIVEDDRMVIFCWLSLGKLCGQSIHTEKIRAEMSDGFSKLEKNLEDLLSSKQDSDVVMSVGYHKFQVHRAILRARSTVFASMLKHNMKEQDCEEVKIDCDPEIFEQFLLSVYTGKVKYLTSENVHPLYQLAQKYDIQDLKTTCGKYMGENLSLEDFCDVMRFALRHKDSELIESVSRFFVNNAQKIVVMEEWLSFLKENPAEANELTIKTLNFLKDKSVI